jgi:hypothetical protein
MPSVSRQEPTLWAKQSAQATRTFLLATAAVPIVISGLMPQLHEARVRAVSDPFTKARPAVDVGREASPAAAHQA